MIGRADFFWKQFNTIAEVDGALKYADPDRARQQLRRDADLRDAGFEVVHFTWQEITQAPEYVAASIRAAFARGAFDSAASESSAASKRSSRGSESPAASGRSTAQDASGPPPQEARPVQEASGPALRPERR